MKTDKIKLFSVKKDVVVTKDFVLPHKKALVIEFSGCSLKCNECYNDCNNKLTYGPDYITFTDPREFFLWIIQIMNKKKVFNIKLTGGEPFEQEISNNFEATQYLIENLLYHSNSFEAHNGILYIESGYDPIYIESFMNDICNAMNPRLNKKYKFVDDKVIFIKCGRYLEKYRPYFNFKGTKLIPPFKIFVRSNKLFNTRFLPSTNQELYMYVLKNLPLSDRYIQDDVIHVSPIIPKPSSKGGVYNVKELLKKYNKFLAKSIEPYELI